VRDDRNEAISLLVVILVISIAVLVLT